jgi:hypothetical protein
MNASTLMPFGNVFSPTPDEQRPSMLLMWLEARAGLAIAGQAWLDPD